jgi:hypothetical protein
MFIACNFQKMHKRTSDYCVLNCLLPYSDRACLVILSMAVRALGYLLLGGGGGGLVHLAGQFRIRRHDKNVVHAAERS